MLIHYGKHGKILYKKYDWAGELDDTLFDTYDEPALRKIVDKHKHINQEMGKGTKGKVDANYLA